ncbi:MerR family transcriptional regulator [Acidihalobacter yilgarnensis]|uniref:MerR family transcriptional regulator n=1 Tax=Acidihalobacter yilgarnensis TaxID=2819280 RepID=A0A1D8IKT2_9GAMM|nr:chaperone modulator CbpM [Acidihalobacter yilgarnensis]AOU97089.1 MerR family transcriptional regulator [Acidihalobacter yilgarnensis]
MTREPLTPLSGELIGDELELTLTELCITCGASSEHIVELAEEGIVSPLGGDVPAWRFRVIEVRRVYRALRLQRDLGVNVAGAALALELLDEIEALRARLGTPGS